MTHRTETQDAPFAGSGSVIDAAERLGASAWVCDADPMHAAAMRRRAERAQSQVEIPQGALT